MKLSDPAPLSLDLHRKTYGFSNRFLIFLKSQQTVRALLSGFLGFFFFLCFFFTAPTTQILCPKISTEKTS